MDHEPHIVFPSSNSTWPTVETLNPKLQAHLAVFHLIGAVSKSPERLPP